MTTPPNPFASPTPTADPADYILHITDSASVRLNALFANKPDTTPMLRLTVTGGGCSGFQYKFGYDSVINDGDYTYTHNGATVVSDKQSMALLTGSSLDFVDDMMGANFRIDNPAATISCGCGSSFNI